jgi:hypothetical protein
MLVRTLFRQRSLFELSVSELLLRWQPVNTMSNVGYARVVLFVAILICGQALWHPYDAHKHYDPSCDHTEENFKTMTRPVSESNHKKWKLWPDVISKQDLTDGETMYGFEAGMEAIWRNQHPADCSTAKYLISGGFESGFGSEIHVIGVGLALAMNMGRVYVMFPDHGDSSLTAKMDSLNRFQVDIDYCKNQGPGKLSLDCYYEPWSSCTIEDALNGSTLQTLRTNGQHLFVQDFVKMEKAPARAYIVQLGDSSDILPKELHNLWACSPFSPEKYRYWWRSLSAAYLLRPNEPTRQLIMKHREDPEMRFDHNQQQCVSVHIRRGDKHLEMRMIDDETTFYNSGKSLWEGVKNRTHSTQEKGIMFLGSEDPNVFATAAQWAEKNAFEVRYANLFDRAQVTTGLTNDEQQKARKENAFKHHEWEYFNMILTLDGHIRCSAFVCTHRSNYCRVIDELRATVGHKANKVYADWTCEPPCIDSPNTGIDW